MQEGSGVMGVSNTTQIGAAETEEEKIQSAILEENTAAIDLYMKAGGDIELVFKTGRSLLTESCFWKKYKVVKLLIDLKADRERKDRSGKSAVDYAQTDDQLRRLLFPEFVMAQKKALIQAIQSGQLVAVKKALEDNPPINFIALTEELGLEIEKAQGETPLTLCILLQQDNIMRLLAQPKLGIDINMKNTKGESPLQIARQLPSRNIEKILLRLGATE